MRQLNNCTKKLDVDSYHWVRALKQPDRQYRKLMKRDAEATEHVDSQGRGRVDGFTFITPGHFLTSCGGCFRRQ